MLQLLTATTRKDRSSSWSGRPLWMEVEDAKRIKVRRSGEHGLFAVFADGVSGAFFFLLLHFGC